MRPHSNRQDIVASANAARLALKAAEDRSNGYSSSGSDSDDKVVPFEATRPGERRTSNLSSSDGDSSRRKRGSSARARDYVTASPASQAPTAAETDCPIAAAATSARKALSAQQELVTVAHENAADGEAGEHERLSQRSNLPPITQQDSEVCVRYCLGFPWKTNDSWEIKLTLAFCGCWVGYYDQVESGE